MPTRMLREGLIESEAVLSLPPATRWFYVTLLLQADDLGLFEAGAFKLARKADLERDSGEQLLQEVAAQDLVRLYVAGNGKRYGFLPKFGQRLQIRRAKHPLPPAHLYADDDDAAKKINELAEKTPLKHGEAPVHNGNPPPEARSEKREAKRNTNTSYPPIGGLSPPAPAATPAPAGEEGFTLTPPGEAEAPPDNTPPCPQKRLLLLYRETCRDLTQHRVETWEGSQGSRDLAARWRWLLTTRREDGSRYAETTAEGVAWWAKFFGEVQASDFLSGRAGSWRADLQWLVRRANFDKVINGNYTNKPQGRR